MWKFALLPVALTACALAQAPAAQVELANLREDVRGLVQRVGELALRVEQLERENHELRAKSGASERSFVTLGQLDAAITDLGRAIKSSVSSSKSETLQQVSAQLEKLGKQTNAALDSLAKAQGARAPVQTNFAEDFPKEGVTYTVQKGDTLAVIAKKTGARQQDIINANKLADPSLIRLGQTLFIPTRAPETK